MYDRNIFGSSSVVFGSLRQSSIIFGKCSVMLGKCSEAFVWPLEQLWKIFGNLPKMVGNPWKIVKNVVISTFSIGSHTVSSSIWN